MNEIIPVILCGGMGTRLWPLSTQSRPKPFLKLDDNRSFLQKSVLRADIIAGTEIILISNSKYQNLIKQDLAEIQSELKSRIHLIFEPVGRNTAGAIAAACQYIKHNLQAEAIVQILTADQLIKPEAKFFDSIRQAKSNLSPNDFIIYGINPTYPATIYGYAKIKSKHSSDLYLVDKFVEKPDSSTAKQYLKEGGYFWNSGMFMFFARDFLQALEQFAPQIASSINQLDFKAENQELTLDPSYQNTPNISVDYAIFEKLSNIKLVKTDFEWLDVGSLKQYYQLFQVDSNYNTNLSHNSDLLDSKNTILDVVDKKIVAVGLDNIAIIQGDDRLIICHQDKLPELASYYKKNILKLM